MSVIWALENYRSYFNELPVRIITNHRALEHLTSGRNFSGRMIRWTIRLNEFNVVIEQRPVSSNVFADCLSRALWQENEVKDDINCLLLTSWLIQSRQELIEEQIKDPALSNLIQAIQDRDSMASKEFRIWGQ